MSEKNKRPTAEIINPGLGDIEKVRDILFGKYVSDFQHRFAALEERLEADVEQLTQRLSDKIDGMDDAVNKSLEQIEKRIQGEQSNRDQELNSMQETLSKAEQSLQHSINLIEDQAAQDLAVLKESLKNSHEELLDTSNVAQEQLKQQIAQQKEALEQDKVGRQALALLFDEAAIKLRGTDK